MAITNPAQAGTGPSGRSAAIAFVAGAHRIAAAAQLMKRSALQRMAAGRGIDAPVSARPRPCASTHTTTRRLRALVLGGVVAIVAGCGDPGYDRLGATAGGAAQAREGDGATLAYEHTVGVQLDGTAIVPRLQEIQAACRDARFGACTLIEAQQSAGERPQARAVLRMAPAGIEPMIALAGEGGDAGERSTRTEDLAVAVRDTATEQDRLARELQRLQAFEARSDLSVADMIALSERLAAVEAQAETTRREGAQHRRRIDTQLLTIDLRARDGEQGRGEIVRALGEVGATLAMGTAWTIRAAAFLLPLGLVLLAAAAVLRAAWRRRRRG
ncbi:DUF4349 domain-containing protein [Luteimonas sp. WGS1318]|uniref:DUF4349 domain-containing protein n=1 Tax=Luteimonas sp. WGS1318 TaxID=3366815 RepID=UPI00372D8414